ncbi:MAG: Cj0069 family protein [Desulfobacterales bacterium]|nr:Cj0069 family protein [Desulfobacterales bacterium]
MTLVPLRGNGGNGVWKVALLSGDALLKHKDIVRVRHAKRGSIEEEIRLEDFFTRCESYFSMAGKKMIDQAYQDRLPEGMVRCYLVKDKIVGFGHQAINALFPIPPNSPPSEAPQPGPRLYHPPTVPEFQALKQKVEQKWVPEMQRILEIDTERLPILWDCDFLFGQKKASGEDTYVLCEINVSSVAPFPDSAPPSIADAVFKQLREIGKRGY